jgi:hypothetical protein
MEELDLNGKKLSNHVQYVYKMAFPVFFHVRKLTFYTHNPNSILHTIAKASLTDNSNLSTI